MTTTATPLDVPAQRAPEPQPAPKPAIRSAPTGHTRGQHADVHTSVTTSGTPVGETYTRKTLTDWIDEQVSRGWKLQAADLDSAVLTRKNLTRVYYPCPHAPAQK